jgi:hypothetical protein
MRDHLVAAEKLGDSRLHHAGLNVHVVDDD